METSDAVPKVCNHPQAPGAQYAYRLYLQAKPVQATLAAAASTRKLVQVLRVAGAAPQATIVLPTAVFSQRATPSLHPLALPVSTHAPPTSPVDVVPLAVSAGFPTVLRPLSLGLEPSQPLVILAQQATTHARRSTMAVAVGSVVIAPSQIVLRELLPSAMAVPAPVG